jgi:hypothetical protein
MPEKTPQTFANHVRFDPLFHFFLAPVSLVLFVWAVIHLVRHYSLEAVAFVVFALLLFLTIFKTRTYALKVQDRVIRLEERLRLARLLPPGAALPELTERQLIALRFACDAESPSLAQKAASQQLGSKQIKQAIQTWRPDYWRV